MKLACLLAQMAGILFLLVSCTSLSEQDSKAVFVPLPKSLQKPPSWKITRSGNPHGSKIQYTVMRPVTFTAIPLKPDEPAPISLLENGWQDDEPSIRLHQLEDYSDCQTLVSCTARHGETIIVMPSNVSYRPIDSNVSRADPQRRSQLAQDETLWEKHEHSIPPKFELTLKGRRHPSNDILNLAVTLVQRGDSAPENARSWSSTLQVPKGNLVVFKPAWRNCQTSHLTSRFPLFGSKKKDHQIQQFDRYLAVRVDW